MPDLDVTASVAESPARETTRIDYCAAGPGLCPWCVDLAEQDCGQ